MSSLNVPAISLAVAATNAGVSIPLDLDNITRISLHAEYGDITGTLKVEGSNDPRARCDHPQYSSSLWDDVTTSFGLTNPAGSAADWTFNFDNVNYAYLRISYTHSSGTGVLYIWFTGKSV